MASYMAITRQDTTLSKDAIKQLREEDFMSLQFKMVDGVHLVHRLLRPLTNMANHLLAGGMVKVGHGPIKFITSQVRALSSNCNKRVLFYVFCR